MKNQINYLISLLLFFFISNIYAKTERFDKLLENQINKPIHNKYKEITDVFLNNGESASRIVRIMQKLDFDSSSVVDSVIVSKENGDSERHTYTYDSNGNNDWDEGVAGMKVGGIRKLVVPPNMAYGDLDMGIIKPGSVLVFEIELLEVAPSTE